MLDHKFAFFDTQSATDLLAEARTASGCGRPRVTVVGSGPGYEVREISLAFGEELPFRRNACLAKTWRVLSGVGHADVAETEMALITGAEIVIEPGVLHQIENRCHAPLVLRETRVSTDYIAAAAEVV